jgi:dGTPase
MPFVALGSTSSQRIDALAHDAVDNSAEGDHIRMSEATWRMMDELREFLFENVYIGSIAKTEEDKAVRVMESLAQYYLDNPDEMPPEFRPESEDQRAIKVCDYVAGMTDRYALTKYGQFFLPRSWMVD